jgi:hypothetical protein
MTAPTSPMVSSGVTGVTTSLSSHAIKRVMKNVFDWMPSNLGYMYFNEQGYNKNLVIYLQWIAPKLIR